MDHATCHTSKGPVQIAISSPNHSRLHYVISSACVPILIKSLATIIIQKYKIKYSRPMMHPFLKSRAFRNECTRLVMWTLLAYSRGILPRGLICAGSSSMSRGVLGYNGVLEIMPPRNSVTLPRDLGGNVLGMPLYLPDKYNDEYRVERIFCLGCLKC